MSIQLDDNDYKLVYLDTNILRYIIDNKDGFGKAIFEKFYSSSDEKYALCFSIENIIEIKPYEDIYERFLDFFSKIPHIMFYHYRMLLSEEDISYKKSEQLKLNEKVMRAFTPLSDDNLRKFLDNLFIEIQIDVDKSIVELDKILDAWKVQRTINEKLFQQYNFESKHKEDYYWKFEKETIEKDLIVENIILNNSDMYKSFYSLRMMEYSLFCRFYTTKKELFKNDIIDIKFSSFIPYVDAVITENFQADVCRKAKSRLPKMSGIKVYSKRDIINY